MLLQDTHNLHSLSKLLTILLLFCLLFVQTSQSPSSNVNFDESVQHKHQRKPPYRQDMPTALPLWPDDVPGERPNTFGTEEWKCNTGENHKTWCSIFNVTKPVMYPYLVQHSDAVMIVAPGGGYSTLSIDNEGTDIALWLNSIGISAFVLKYRVPGRPWLSFGEAPLMDAQRAMGVVRGMAGGNSTNIPHLNASKIGFIGFSAGGHLTGHINVAWAKRAYPKLDRADILSCRPDYSIMVYPWRSVSQPPVNESIAGASALNVTNQTPPTLLIQTEDDWAHVENAIFYFLALKQNHAAPSELHVYPSGGHGYGRCVFGDAAIHRHEVCSWPDRAEVFLNRLGVVDGSKIGKARSESNSAIES